ncbi:MAG: serine/threonine protein kinase, partial [Gemmataceae bacterium]|nr:serine/threonine protein kinase [Gemmataceae bacterium]
MDTLAHCPAPERLSRWLLGLPPGDDATLVEGHFLRCPSCQAAARAAPGDTLTEALARPPLPEEGASLYRTADDLPTDGIGWLDGYRVVRLVGSGGMGQVYEAEDAKLGRRVAIKVMAARLAADPSARERFLREARAAASVESPHVVTVHHVGCGPGTSPAFPPGPLPYIVMPLLAGESLEARCRREGRLPLDEVARIGAEAAAGLAAAHARGVVHRDIKPANLWLEGDEGRVKLLDFGLARCADSGAGLTEQGAILGTPAYLAPEQGRADAGPRVDLFSLGCVLWQLAA